MTDARYVAHCNTGVSPPTVGVQYIPATPLLPSPNTAWLYRNGVRAEGRAFEGTPVAFDYLTPGTYTVKIYTESDVFISESAPFTVPDTVTATPAPAPAPTPAPVATPSVATAFTTALSSSSGTVGNAVTLTVTPIGAAWPSSVVLAPTVAGLSGTFAPTTRTPSGTTATTFAFTPSAAGSGSIGVISTSSMTAPAGLAYQATTAVAPTPTPTSITSATLAADGVTLTVVLSQAATITGSAIINVNGSVDTLTWSNAATATTTHTGVLTTAAHSGDTVNLSVAAGFTTPALASSASVAVTNNSTVAAPPTPAPAPTSDGTLAGLPSTIVAGQPLSAVTYTAQSQLYLSLYRVSGGVEEGARWQVGVMPGGTLSLLIPQTAGAYTVRGFAAATGGSATYESGQINVTVAPGALPATPTQTADTGATSSGVTTNWTATASSYRVLARPGVGSAYGSLADATVSTNSYTFTGRPTNSSPRTVVIPQNASGYGTPSGQFLSFTTA